MKAIKHAFKRPSFSPVKSLVLQPKRYFFSQMGFEDFNETDVLMNIENGVYFHTPPTEGKQKKDQLRFDKRGRLLIYDSSSHYLLPRPPLAIPIYTTVSTFIASQ